MASGHHHFMTTSTGITPGELNKLESCNILRVSECRSPKINKDHPSQHLIKS
jgi:hypothetical protein